MAIFASNRLLLTTLFATGLAVYFSPAECINCFLSLSGIWNKLNEWNPNQSWICHHRFSTNQVSNNYHLLQFLCSSSPLGQSFVPSHCLAFAIHANVLPHWNSSGLQVPVQTKFMNGHYINKLKKWILHDHDRAWVLHLPQLVSSDPSWQFWVPSHLWVFGIQPPLWQANWLLVQLLIVAKRKHLS